MLGNPCSNISLKSKSTRGVGVLEHCHPEGCVPCSSCHLQDHCCPPFLSHIPQANFHLPSVTCPFVSIPTPSLVWSLPSLDDHHGFSALVLLHTNPCSYIPCRGSLGWLVLVHVRSAPALRLRRSVALQPTWYGGCKARVEFPPILKNQHSHPD